MSSAAPEVKAEEQKLATIKPAPIAMGDRGIKLTTLEEAFRFAQAVVKSGLAPKGCDTPEKALIAMQAGAELGFSPMRALAAVTVINGKAGLMGDAALAKINESGVCTRPPVVTTEGKGDERAGVVRFQRKNMPEAIEVTFSVADAKRAHLWGKSGPWTDYGDTMLGWRAVSRMCKLYFGDVLMGLTVTEELRDYPATTTERRPVAPPPEPDPLLAGAVVAQPPVVATEAEVVQENTTGQESTSAPAGSVATESEVPKAATSIPPDEQKLTREVEKFEGRIVSAGSLSGLEAAWAEAAPLIRKLSEAEQKRLNKLFRQLAKNFEK